MVMGDFHAVFEPNVYKEFVQIVGKGNVTKSFQQYMMNVVATSKKDIGAINIQILTMEIERLQKKSADIASELQTKLQIREKHETLVHNEEEKRLKKEKEHILSQKTCLNCQRVLSESEKRHTFKLGVVCNGCFMVDSSKKVGVWNGSL